MRRMKQFISHFLKSTGFKKGIRIGSIIVICLVSIYLIALLLEFSIIGTVRNINSNGRVELDPIQPCTYWMFDRLLSNGESVFYLGDASVWVPDTEKISVGDTMYVLYLWDGYCLTIRLQSEDPDKSSFIFWVIDQVAIMTK